MFLSCSIPTIYAIKMWPDQREAFIEGEDIEVFCYLSASEIWHDKRGDLWWVSLLEREYCIEHDECFISLMLSFLS